MSNSSLQQLLDDAVANRIVPCAILSVLSCSGPARRYLAGRHRYDRGPALQEQDLFDLASLTKVVATTAVVMRLVEDGRIELDAPLARYLPDFAAAQPEQRAWRTALSIRQLLAHCGGLPAGYPFHSRHAQVSNPSERRALLLAVPMTTAPGSAALYSDLGPMLLAELISAVSGKDLATAAQDMVFTPLGMTSACFNPPAERRSHCVPTELIVAADSDAGEAWQGVVHDENARWYGGVAGHAGLFAAAADLERFARMLLNDGAPLYDPATVRLFTRPAGLIPGSSRCLGWDSPSNPCSGGTQLSPRAFGHTGFTGTSFWIDPPKDLAVILLSNAVHPRRNCKERGYFSWRNRVHSAAYEKT
ncbi:MAG: serine hydrolase domain-containing protein [Lentisphaeria bacterium]|jgi:CubicO group peptidase (beta-lactamase class C family)